MSWKMHFHEFETVSALTAPERYSYFIKKVCDWKSLWGLKGSAGWALGRSEDGRDYIPVWPHEQFARACATEAWAGYEPVFIELSSWLQRWIPGMLQDKKNAAVFMTPANTGVSVMPDRLQADLEAELSKYEE